MVKVDEENLVTPVGDGRNSAQKMRDRLKAQAYLGEQNFLENRRREERKKTKEKNDYPDDNWFSTEDETFVVATKRSNP